MCGPRVWPACASASLHVGPRVLLTPHPRWRPGDERDWLSPPDASPLRRGRGTKMARGTRYATASPPPPSGVKPCPVASVYGLRVGGSGGSRRASLQLGAGSCQSPALDHAGRREQSLTPLISEGAFHEGQKTEERNSASFVTSAAKPPLFSALFIFILFLACDNIRGSWQEPDVEKVDASVSPWCSVIFCCSRHPFAELGVIKSSHLKIHLLRRSLWVQAVGVAVGDVPA